jgi:hypothetical protein
VGSPKNLRIGESDIRSTPVKFSKEPNNDETRCVIHFKRFGESSDLTHCDPRSGKQSCLLFRRRALIEEPAWVPPTLAVAGNRPSRSVSP